MEENKEEYKRFTVSLPQELYDKIEMYRTELEISRSDAIRRAMNQFLKERDLEEGSLSNSTEIVGCITMVMIHEHIKVDDTSFKHDPDIDYDHNHDLDNDQEHNHDHDHDHKHVHQYTSKPLYASVQHADLLKANDYQHHFRDVIISTMHLHLEFEKCMEIIAVAGPYKRVLELKKSLESLKSVIVVKFLITPKK